MKYRARYWILTSVMLLASVCIILRMVDLNIRKRNFLLKQSQARIQRIVSVPAHRGMITDRNGKPLAISAHVKSVWVNPKEFHLTNESINHVSHLLGMKKKTLRKILNRSKQRHFVYLKRDISPELGEQLLQLDLEGLYLQKGYKRFYPETEVTAHVIGFTNVDDHGQEGIELAYDHQLCGISGKKEVIKDRRGHIIANLKSIREPIEGRDLSLSIDSNIQYLAYHELKKAIDAFHAEDGSVVVIDVTTGEILAMVNLPSFNPNHIQNTRDGRLRNRAVTDQFEPGSTIKAFSMSAILASGKYRPTDKINTNPGWIKIDGYIIKDVRNHGILTVSETLQKSSNVGFAKMLQHIDPELLWKTYHDLGFGEVTYVGFPGEVSGSLTHKRRWSMTDVASLSRGYGLSVTTLQLAHAYATVANGGVAHPVSLLKLDRHDQGERKLSKSVVRKLFKMLETVTQKGGTGTRARVSGYRVAGKTGTAYVAGPKGYDRKHYMSSFIGFAPVSKPKLVVAVVIHNPKKHHFGGVVAAPAFANVMAGALRLLAVTPDNINITS